MKVIQNAIITPRQFKLGNKFSGEVYNADGELCDLSLRPSSRAVQKHCPEPNHARVKARLSGHYLYISDIFEHFGHDLIELTGRLWPLLDNRYDGVIAQVWRMDSNHIQAKMNCIALKILAAFGVPFDKIFVLHGEPVSVERLTVPEPALRIHDYALTVMRTCFEHLANIYGREPVGGSPTAVFFSRGRLGANLRSPHEAEIQRIARRLGVVILHPQDLSFEGQIALMRKVRVVVGLDGSALHLCAFCDPGAAVVAFDARNVENQYVLEELMGHTGDHIDIRGAVLPSMLVHQALKNAMDSTAERRRWGFGAMKGAMKELALREGQARL